MIHRHVYACTAAPKQQDVSADIDHNAIKYNNLVISI